MATPHLPEDAYELVTVEEASALTQPTEYPVSERTVRRWVTEKGLRRVRLGDRGAYRISYTDLLEVQRDAARRAGLNP